MQDCEISNVRRISYFSWFATVDMRGRGEIKTSVWVGFITNDEFLKADTDGCADVVCNILNRKVHDPWGVASGKFPLTSLDGIAKLRSVDAFSEYWARLASAMVSEVLLNDDDVSILKRSDSIMDANCVSHSSCQ